MSNVIAFDDGPFSRDHRGDVLLVGVVCAGTRVDGILSGRVRRDGVNATRVMTELVQGSPFRANLSAVLLQGIAVGGFNVVDVHGLSAALQRPVLVVTRRRPNMAAVREALFSGSPHDRPAVRGVDRKWALIERAGAMERLEPSRRSVRAAKAGPTGLRDGVFPRLWVQRAGLSMEEARDLVLATTLHGNIPEGLRLAHLIAGGITTGVSRGRA